MTEKPREKVGRLPLTLSNVYAGRVFSSYRELCKELGLEIKTGEAKINQMKDLNKVLKISTEGYKIRIEEIRDGEELKEIERREGEERLEKDCEMGRRDVDGRKTHKDESLSGFYRQEIRPDLALALEISSYQDPDKESQNPQETKTKGDNLLMSDDFPKSG